MKTALNSVTTGATISVATIAICASALNLLAQDAKQPILVENNSVAVEETEMDLPAGFHRFYGQRINQWSDSERRIAKLDIDGDMNYDGTIDNDDPADNGAFEATPPGLVIGEGELTRVMVRVSPYRVDFTGEIVVTLEIEGINRALRSGQFASLADEVASTGRVKVWRDAERTELLLDSADQDRRVYEWVVDDQVWPTNLPGVYPRVVYVEGISESKGYPGDLRLLATISHRPKGGNRENYPALRKSLLSAYRTSFDHILFTVRNQPQPKEYINNNAEGVWSAVDKVASSGGK